MKKVTLTKEDIQKLASLSKIKLSDEEVEKFTKDMETIISSVETLENFEEKTNSCLKKVEYNQIPFEELREDVAGNSMKQEDALANAPQQQSGYFKVYGDIFDGDNS